MRAEEEKYRQMSPKEHVLYNPSMYIGPVVPQVKEMRYFDEETRSIRVREMEIAQGFCGIFDEILMNAADNFFHSQDVRMTQVEVCVGKAAISVRNDGRGIPIRKHADTDMYIPQLIFSEWLTSSNYATKNRITGGMNGQGAKLTNIFSTHFEVELSLIHI